MKSILIIGANIVNEGRITPGDVFAPGYSSPKPVKPFVEIAHKSN